MAYARKVGKTVNNISSKLRKRLPGLLQSAPSLALTRAPWQQLYFGVAFRNVPGSQTLVAYVLNNLSLQRMRDQVGVRKAVPWSFLGHCPGRNSFPA